MDEKPTARRVFRRVIVLNKDAESVANAYREIGNTYKEQQKNEKAAAYQKAVTFYQQAIRLKPNNADAHSGLGSTYVELGRKQEALQVYRKLLALDKKKAQELNGEIKGTTPQPALKSSKAAGQPANESLPRLEEAVRLNPKNAQAFHDLGMALFKLALFRGDRSFRKSALTRAEEGTVALLPGTRPRKNG
jgi:Flp pilus assembly protein TadD